MIQKKSREKLIVSSIFLLSFLFLTSNAYAMTAALVVKNADSLSDMHERRIKYVLDDMGFDITLVDEDVSVDYHDFNIVIVAGRLPGDIGDFAIDIPVNEVPTIGMGNDHIDDWGWADSPGISSWTSSKKQSIYIMEEHALTWGFFLDEKVYVHSVQGYNIIDLVDEYTNLESVASPTTQEKFGAIRYGLPGTMLQDGKQISGDSAVVFFGITYPVYWTDKAEALFKNAVNWLTTDTDDDGLLNYMDNCMYIANPGQADIDEDGIGDACDPEDNRPDLIVTSADTPSTRIECENLSLSVIVENIGNGDAASFDIELKVGEAIYEAAVDGLEVGEDDSMAFSIAGEDLCGSSKKTLTATVKNSQPSETDETNNELTAKIIFTTVKDDVDSDAELEEAEDRNDDIEDDESDGYESYSDAGSNTDVTALDGDPDGMTDYLIDIGKGGTFERYWDPDDKVLTDVIYHIDNETGNATDVIEVDFDGDGDIDFTYNITSDEIDYMDDVPPVIGTVQVDPSFDDNGKTWYLFGVSATATDYESSIDDDSCEYTTNGVDWYSAEYDSGSGRCYKNGLSAYIGQSLTLNIRAKDKVGNSATGSEVTRTVSVRPLKITIETDKSSYSPGSSATVSVYVSYDDNGERVGGATVRYVFDSSLLEGVADGNGLYEFSLAVPDSYGTYGLDIEAEHTHAQGSGSIDIDVPEPSTTQSESSQSSQGGGIPSMALILTMPDKLSAYAGTDEQFVIKVKNIGYMTSYSTKINIDSGIELDIPYDVFPDMVNIESGETQDFTVTLHVPEDDGEGADVIGKHRLNVWALSYGNSIPKRMDLTIMEKDFPVVEATAIETSEFYEGVPAEVSIVLKNVGYGTALVTENVFYPSGWDFETSTKTVSMEPGDEKTVSFTVTPSNTSGKVEFATAYDSRGERMIFMNSTDVTVNLATQQGGSGKQGYQFTGMFADVFTSMGALVTNPGFYLPTLAIVAASGLAVKSKMSAKTSGSKRGLASKKSSVKSRSRRRSSASSYKVWESKHKRSRSR